MGRKKKKRKFNYFRCIVFVLFLACLAGGVFWLLVGKKDDKVAVKPNPPKTLTTEERAAEIVKGMTLEEKVGQVFLVVPEQVDDCGHDVVEQCIGFKENQAKYNVGGVILFGNNLKNPEQTKKLIASMQSSSKYPMFVAVDEEGGLVARVADTKAMGIKNVGPMKSITDAEKAYQVGNTMGTYLHDLGFNLDFAPVADVLINPKNTEIGNRSFGSDATKCGEFAGAVTKGLQERKVMATLKHFPGHGGFESNSHEGLSLSKRNLEELRKTEFVAFKKAFANEPSCVMVAHMSMPNLVGDNTPTTLSHKVVTDILKNELGYKGIVVSDALNMGAIVKFYGAEEAAVKSLNAGVDVLLMPEKLGAAYKAVLKAVKDGKVKQERLDDAVTKIVLGKLKYGIIK